MDLIISDEIAYQQNNNDTKEKMNNSPTDGLIYIYLQTHVWDIQLI